MTSGSSFAQIVRVEFHLISVPLSRRFEGSVYAVEQKNAILTRVHCADGIVGECINGEGRLPGVRDAYVLLRDQLASRLIGRDATEIEAIWQDLWKITLSHSMAPRAAVRAVACIDSALWDGLGKRAGLPLFRLWGGARTSVPIIAIGGQYRDGFEDVDYAEEMAEFRSLGLAGCKFKVGGRSPEIDARRTAAARSAVPDNFVLCADANRGWSREDAHRYAQLVADCGVRWFEEPCHWSNERRDLAWLRQHAGLPIAAGQSEITAEGCFDLMMANAIDICNLDASWGGGPTAWRRVAGAAACIGIQMAHHGEPVIGAHLLAATASGTYLETHHPSRDPIFHRAVAGRGMIADGVYHMSEAPGFGVQYDDEFLAKYTLDRVQSETST
jgi:D-galactarolactone cycloisomerase